MMSRETLDELRSAAHSDENVCGINRKGVITVPQLHLDPDRALPPDPATDAAATSVRNVPAGLVIRPSFQAKPPSSLTASDSFSPPFRDTVQTRPSPILSVTGRPDGSRKSAWISFQRE